MKVFSRGVSLGSVCQKLNRLSIFSGKLFLKFFSKLFLEFLSKIFLKLLTKIFQFFLKNFRKFSCNFFLKFFLRNWFLFSYSLGRFLPLMGKNKYPAEHKGDYVSYLLRELRAHDRVSLGFAAVSSADEVEVGGVVRGGLSAQVGGEAVIQSVPQVAGGREQLQRYGRQVQSSTRRFQWVSSSQGRVFKQQLRLVFAAFAHPETGIQVQVVPLSGGVSGSVGAGYSVAAVESGSAGSGGVVRGESEVAKLKPGFGGYRGFGQS